MELSKEQICELKSTIKSALRKLYVNDVSLIKRHVHERSIAFRFGLYFFEEIKGSSFSNDADLSIDFDYNRNKEQVKDMEGFSETHGVYPDIVLHRREHNDKNIVVIEFKGVWSKYNNARRNDYLKLIGFTHPNLNDYQYGLGVFVDLGEDMNGCDFTYFIKGNPCNELERI